jgi:hypothetical protein
MLLIRSLKSTILAIAVVLTLGVSSAAATNEIEGTWSFNGGGVAIQPLSNGTFQGTVVAETSFAECPHTVGEVMWTGMTPQADGSLSGFHQWFHSECKLESSFVGPTAWRVLHTADGVRLKVCFSHPGDSQPTIAADGTSASATYGCSESSPLAPLSKVEGDGTGNGGSGSGSITFSKTVVLPPATACVSQTSLKIKLKDPKYDPLKEVVVKIAGKKVADVKGVKILKKGVTLKKLPSGTYKVAVVATTVLNQRLTGTKTYKACTKGSGKIGLKGSKKHH